MAFATTEALFLFISFFTIVIFFLLSFYPAWSAGVKWESSRCSSIRLERTSSLEPPAHQPSSQPLLATDVKLFSIFKRGELDLICVPFHAWRSGSLCSWCRLTQNYKKPTSKRARTHTQNHIHRDSFPLIPNTVAIALQTERDAATFFSLCGQ